jgi:hypothetical protein
MKKRLKSLLSKLDVTKGPKAKLKSAVKKLLLANFAAGAAGGAVGAIGTNYLFNKSKDKSKK